MSECRYDCSENRTLAHIPPYGDISGVGVSDFLLAVHSHHLFKSSQVIVGYTAIAGIAVLIILIDYFIAYRPELDPFRSESENVGNPIIKPHPVDKLFLDSARQGSWAATVIASISRNKHVEKALLKVYIAPNPCSYGKLILVVRSGDERLSDTHGPLHHG